NFGDIEIVTDQNLAEPQYRYLDGAAGANLLHAGWIDRRDTPTEGHNVYTCERSTHPDLSPFAPAGWNAPLVGNMFAGERSTGYLAAGRRAFISFAFINNGLADIAADFRIELRVDGSAAAAWELTGGLPVSTYVVVEDHQLILDAGPHQIAFAVDTLDDVAESDESDNVTAETWTWLAGDPVLRVEPDHVMHQFAAPPGRVSLDRLAADPPTQRVSHVEVLGETLRAALAKAAPDGTLTVIIEPVLRVDARALDAALGDIDRGRRRETTVAALRATLERAGAELAPVFTELAAAGLLERTDALWLAGSYAANAKPAGVHALAAAPAVGRIWLDDRTSRTYGAAAASSPRDGGKALAWHLPRIGADQAWAQGFDGTGVLVGHVDTGVSYDHPDLADRMWDGGGAWPHHGYDAVDDDDDPYDGDTSIHHGTHTAGLIVGDGTGGTATGAAPGATLMALRAVPGYYSDMVEAMQFGLDNGPVDVFSMSAGWDDPAGDLKEANRANADILLAMGVAWITAAGNGDNTGGHFPLPQDIGTPADCPDPWFGAAGHSAVIAVGATTNADAVWPSSSLGPTVWAIAGTGYDDYPYPPGLMKPDIAAPGVDITSTLSSSGYVAYSGTSMSCPLVAGAAAILLQATPGATPTLLAEALETSATDIGAPGRDNAAGAGLLNIPAALEAMPLLGVETFTVYNDGVLPLSLADVTWQAGWLDVTPLTGRVNPGDALVCRATFDPAGLPTGLYYDDIVLESDDPAGPHTVRAKLIIGDVTGADDPPPTVLSATALQNHPNPFNPRTTLRFNLVRSDRVELAVYDLEGRRLRTLVA
ncbi:S8 family serine peptidase, partial [bacterium]|nr:S8 family serine peptidase [bacterium]